MNVPNEGMTNALDRALSFPDMLIRVFQYFFLLLDQIMRDESLTPQQRLLYGSALTLGFAVVTLASLWFIIFLLRWIFRGVGRLFDAAVQSFSDPASLPYIATLTILRATLWYFSVLLIILLLCGVMAVVSGGFWGESFKYVLGAAVGSLIGVIKKKEESDFEQSLFDAARSVALRAAETKKQDKQVKADKLEPSVPSS